MRENLHPQLSAADISQTKRQGLERTAGGHVWLKDLAVEQGGGTRRQNTDFRSATGAGKLRQVPGNARGSAGNQPEHPLATTEVGRFLKKPEETGI
jgi:hypothetical protein